MMIRIYHLKQRLIGLLCVILPLIFAEFLIENDVAIVMVGLIPAGLYYLFTSKKLLNRDKIMTIKL